MKNRAVGVTSFFVFLALVFLLTPDAQAQNSKKKPVKHVKVSYASPSKKQASKKATAVERAPAAAATRKPTALAPVGDPNKSVEIRGQSRTLSMMLVLKNGKENINFIKVRKDYRPEISSTQF